MTANDLRDALTREPFEPFRIVTSSGESYAVRDPQSVAIMKRRLFIALPRDRWTLVPYLYVTAIEMLPNGKSGRGRRPRR